MARQWRIAFPGALYHVLSRGNGGQAIFLCDDDRRLFLDLLAELSGRFNLAINAYVLMSNHYHLLLQTKDANLSKAMQCIKTQNYSDEKVSIWEDVKHGLIYGGQKFIEDIKARFLSDKKDAELPQHNSLPRTFDAELILKIASEHLGFNL
jgi:REP element-mobilizing transposase RayT